MKAMPASRRRQAGLTLLELLLVVTILSSIAYMTLAVVDDSGNQTRYGDTRNRLDMIRKAVIGDSARTLNGGPEIHGFVADMGRLPANIQELITSSYCSDPQYDNSGDCTTAGETWTALPGYDLDAATGLLWAGWNGPYLPASADSGEFHDGWGNNDGSNNFGWVFDDTTSPNELIIQSLGMDAVAGGSSVYENDYPASGSLVLANDWRVLVTDSNTTAQNDESGGLTVDFGAPPPCWRCTDNVSVTRASCESSGGTWSADSTITDSSACVAAPGQWEPTESLCLRVAYRANGTIATITSSGTNGNLVMTWDGNDKTARFAFEDTVPPDFDEDTWLPQGQLAYRVYEYNGGSCTNNEYPSGAAWRLFSLLPRRALHPLAWAVN